MANKIISSLTDPLPGVQPPSARGPLLELAMLRPADVLLSTSTSEISAIIKSADGGHFSHAALWGGTSVIECVTEGVIDRPLTGLREVFRFRDDSGQALPPAVAHEVVSGARRHIGTTYAHEELLLIGALFAAGVQMQRPVLNAALEAIGGATAGRLAERLYMIRSSREPLICTELVARAYYETGTAHRYAIRILPRTKTTRHPATRRMQMRDDDARDEIDDEERAMTACAQLLRGNTAGEARERKVLFGHVAVRHDSGVPIGYVTPGDLERSPSLVHIGSIAGT